VGTVPADKVDRGAVQGLREGVGVRLQGVVEAGRAVAVAVTEQVDQKRTAAGQQRVAGDLREVGG